jgi:hypothetical protein
MEVMQCRRPPGAGQEARISLEDGTQELISPTGAR